MSLHVTFAYEQSQLPAYRLFLFREFEKWDGLKNRGNFLIKSIQTESFMRPHVYLVVASKPIQ